MPVGTASVIEILWVIGSGIVLLIAARAYRDSFVDLLYVNRAYPTDLPRRIVALGNLRRDSARLIYIFLFFVFGVYSLFQPPVQTTDWMHGALVILVVINAIVACIGSILDRRDRGRLFRIVNDPRYRSPGGRRDPASDFPEV